MGVKLSFLTVASVFGSNPLACHLKGATAALVPDQQLYLMPLAFAKINSVKDQLGWNKMFQIVLCIIWAM
jgi:hypothetical protein